MTSKFINFLDELESNSSLRKKFENSKSIEQSFELAKPYLQDITFDEFKNYLLVVAKKLSTGLTQLDDSELEDIYGGFGFRDVVDYFGNNRRVAALALVSIIGFGSLGFGNNVHAQRPTQYVQAQSSREVAPKADKEKTSKRSEVAQKEAKTKNKSTLKTNQLAQKGQIKEINIEIENKNILDKKIEGANQNAEEAQEKTRKKVEDQLEEAKSEIKTIPNKEQKSQKVELKKTPQTILIETIKSQKFLSLSASEKGEKLKELYKKFIDEQSSLSDSFKKTFKEYFNLFISNLNLDHPSENFYNFIEKVASAKFLKQDQKIRYQDDNGFSECLEQSDGAPIVFDISEFKGEFQTSFNKLLNEAKGRENQENSIKKGFNNIYSNLYKSVSEQNNELKYDTRQGSDNVIKYSEYDKPNEPKRGPSNTERFLIGYNTRNEQITPIYYTWDHYKTMIIITGEVKASDKLNAWTLDQFKDDYKQRKTAEKDLKDKRENLKIAQKKVLEEIKKEAQETLKECEVDQLPKQISDRITEISGSDKLTYKYIKKITEDVKDIINKKIKEIVLKDISIKSEKLLKEINILNNSEIRENNAEWQNLLKGIGELPKKEDIKQINKNIEDLTEIQQKEFGKETLEVIASKILEKNKSKNLTTEINGDSNDKLCDMVYNKVKTKLEQQQINQKQQLFNNEKSLNDKIRSKNNEIIKERKTLDEKNMSLETIKNDNLINELQNYIDSYNESLTEENKAMVEKWISQNSPLGDQGQATLNKLVDNFNNIIKSPTIVQSEDYKKKDGIASLLGKKVSDLKELKNSNLKKFLKDQAPKVISNLEEIIKERTNIKETLQTDINNSNEKIQKLEADVQILNEQIKELQDEIQSLTEKINQSKANV